MKGMFDDLQEEVNFDNRSTTVALLYYGLSSTLMQLDRPTRCISRISRCKPLEISSSVIKFDSTVLPVISSTWISYETVRELLDVISSNDDVYADDIF